MEILPIREQHEWIQRFTGVSEKRCYKKSRTLLTIAGFDLRSFTSIRTFHFAFLSSVFFKPYIRLARLNVFVLKAVQKSGK